MRDVFLNHNDTDQALQVLSNLAELETDDPAVLRAMARGLARAEAYELAVDTFEQVLQLRPDEPQSYRDLALALAWSGRCVATEEKPTRQARAADISRSRRCPCRRAKGRYQRRLRRGQWTC